MSEIHLQKLLASPAFLICIHSLSSSCIMPPHSSPSLPLSLSPSLPPSPPPSCLPLSVLLCLLSSCIAPPALWCGTDNQNSAHIHTRTHGGAHTHTHLQTSRTHTGRHTPTTSGSPPPSLPPSLSHTSPLQTRNILQPLVCQCFIKRHC